MPNRVPEGPVDPYEPFPFAAPAQGSWAPAPIVRGRDIGRPAAGMTSERIEPSDGEAKFVDIEDELSARLPVDTLVSFDEPLEAHAGDGADDLGRIAAFGMGGDGLGAWTVVDTAAIPPPLRDPDPWAVVDVPEAVYEVEDAEPEPSTDASPQLGEASYRASEPHGGMQAPSSPYSARHVNGPPLSSRAILIIGGLALLCLVLAAALAFQALGGEDDLPAMDAPEGASLSSTVPAPRSIRDDATWTSSLPVSDTTLTGIERAAIGPLEIELDRLGRALQGAFGRSSAELAPVLRPYVAHAAERMAVHPARFRLVVEAPNVELALTRSEAIMRAFQSAGVPADKLTMTAAAGMPSVRFER